MLLNRRSKRTLSVQSPFTFCLLFFSFTCSFLLEITIQSSIYSYILLIQYTGGGSRESSFNREESFKKTEKKKEKNKKAQIEIQLTTLIVMVKRSSIGSKYIYHILGFYF